MDNQTQVQQEENTDLIYSFLEIIINRRKIFLRSFLSILGITILIVSFLPQSYEATAKIYLSLPAIPDMEIPYLEEFQQATSFYTNQPDIMGSRVILERVVKRLNLDEEAKILSPKEKLLKLLFNVEPEPLEKAIEDLRNDVDIQSTYTGRVISIISTSKRAKAAAEMSNTVTEVYTEYVNGILSENIEGSYEYLVNRVTESEEELYEAEEQLRQYNERENLTNIDQEVEFLTEQIHNNQIKIEEFENNIQNFDRGSQNARAIRDNSISSQVAGRLQMTESDQHVQDLKDKIDALYSEINSQAGNAQSLEDFRRNLSILEADLSAMTGTNIQNIEARYLNELKLEKKYWELRNDFLTNKIKSLKDRQLEQERLNRIIRNKENALTLALENLEGAGILQSSDIQKSSVRVLEKAVPPIYPSLKTKMVFMILGFVLSFVFASSACFFVEFLDNSVKTTNQAEKVFGVPVFAAIPWEGEQEKKNVNVIQLAQSLKKEISRRIRRQ